MDCREEVAMIERRFKHLPGLEGFHADLIGQRLHVKYDAAKLTASAIAAAVADAGMRAWLEHEEPVAAGDRGRPRRAPRCWPAPAPAFGAGLVAGVSPTRRAAPGDRAATPCSIAAGVPLTARKAWQRRCEHGRSTSTC